MEEEESDDFNVRIPLHLSTKSSFAFTGILGLEYGVQVAHPPGSGDELPMECIASQKLTITSSPDVSS